MYIVANKIRKKVVYSHNKNHHLIGFTTAKSETIPNTAVRAHYDFY